MVTELVHFDLGKPVAEGETRSPYCNDRIEVAASGFVSDPSQVTCPRCKAYLRTRLGSKLALGQARYGYASYLWHLRKYSERGIVSSKAALCALEMARHFPPDEYAAALAEVRALIEGMRDMTPAKHVSQKLNDLRLGAALRILHEFEQCPTRYLAT